MIFLPLFALVSSGLEPNTFLPVERASQLGYSRLDIRRSDIPSKEQFWNEFRNLSLKLEHETLDYTLTLRAKVWLFDSFPVPVTESGVAPTSTQPKRIYPLGFDYAYWSPGRLNAGTVRVVGRFEEAITRLEGGISADALKIPEDPRDLLEDLTSITLQKCLAARLKSSDALNGIRRLKCERSGQEFWNMGDWAKAKGWSGTPDKDGFLIKKGTREAVVFTSSRHLLLDKKWRELPDMAFQNSQGVYVPKEALTVLQQN